ncbi:hypothetical protein D9615_006839 [Tricholomella constricta]|uniref:Uncharacterized protein n=1 Tax=Tricholomella constricta TaxID=117010 RepID=A0A8H5H8N4_9AGAR|nr:hypothetical protein D9615_006839 [Tricholomella constricta]
MMYAHIRVRGAILSLGQPGTPIHVGIEYLSLMKWRHPIRRFSERARGNEMASMKRSTMPQHSPHAHATSGSGENVGLLFTGRDRESRESRADRLFSCGKDFENSGIHVEGAYAYFDRRVRKPIKVRRFAPSQRGGEVRRGEGVIVVAQEATADVQLVLVVGDEGLSLRVQKELKREQEHETGRQWDVGMPRSEKRAEPSIDCFKCSVSPRAVSQGGGGQQPELEQSQTDVET